MRNDEIREHKYTKQSRSIQPQIVFARRVSRKRTFVKISSSPSSRLSAVISTIVNERFSEQAAWHSI
jgi:hypothetical protein